jgi:hypothetical protein
MVGAFEMVNGELVYDFVNVVRKPEGLSELQEPKEWKEERSRRRSQAAKARRKET